TLELSGRRPRTLRSYRKRDPGGPLERIVSLQLHKTHADTATTDEPMGNMRASVARVGRSRKMRAFFWTLASLPERDSIPEIVKRSVTLPTSMPIRNEPERMLPTRNAPRSGNSKCPVISNVENSFDMTSCKLTLELSGRRPRTLRSYRKHDPGGPL